MGIPSGTSPLPELQTSLVPNQKVLGNSSCADVYSQLGLRFYIQGENCFGLTITNLVRTLTLFALFSGVS